MADEQPLPRPPSRIQRIGHTISAVIIHAPVLWPVLKGPMTRFFDDAAAGWDERNRAPSSDHLAPLGIALDRTAGPPPERILDIGTGTGVAALMLAREYPGARVRGIDVSEQMIREARRKTGLDPEGRIHFRVSDAADLPWDDESFDLVAQVNMPPFFSEIARVLRPGGHVVIAHTLGPQTPFYAANDLLTRKFARHEIDVVAQGTHGQATWFCARRAGEPPHDSAPVLD
ncbi:MAG: class I SAM-dependent methyltransferase [Solirubrobacterales bacterium]